MTSCGPSGSPFGPDPNLKHPIKEPGPSGKKSTYHQAWHIANIWVLLYFEQGLMGIAAFALLVILVGCRLLMRIKHGDRSAVIIAAAFLGLLIVGIAESVLDAPRIAFLVYLIAFMSILRHFSSEDGRLIDNSEQENGYPE